MCASFVRKYHVGGSLPLRPHFVAGYPLYGGSPRNSPKPCGLLPGKTNNARFTGTNNSVFGSRTPRKYFYNPNQKFRENYSYSGGISNCIEVLEKRHGVL